MSTAVANGIDVHCVALEQVYDVDGERVIALAGIDVDIAAGETVAVIGPSGSGKSTLTSLLAGLRRPSSGRVELGDVDLGELSERQLLRLRNELIGIVLQNPARSLLPYADAEDNIRFAQLASPRRLRAALPNPNELLTALGLGALAGRPVGTLSGGEQQRLSVAVAMATRPRLLLADEPTSQLDVASRDLVTELLARVAGQFGTTTVVVTHDPAVADGMQRSIALAEGRVAGQSGGWQ
jgi:ABC-type lipoprotein export system ATPase subunit